MPRAGAIRESPLIQLHEIADRPEADDCGPFSPERKEVKVDDVAQMIVRFAGGFGGPIEANWLAIGRTMELSCEITVTMVRLRSRRG